MARAAPASRTARTGSARSEASRSPSSASTSRAFPPPSSSSSRLAAGCGSARYPCTSSPAATVAARSPAVSLIRSATSERSYAPGAGEPDGDAATLLRTLLALIAWIGLPGLAVGALACRRGHEGDTSERFLGVALVAGLSVWLLGSELLVQADALSEGPVVLIGVALAVASLIVLVGPGRAGIKVVLGANEGVTLIVA